MNKKLITAITVLTALSMVLLIFTGCPTDAGDGGKGPVVPPPGGLRSINLPMVSDHGTIQASHDKALRGTQIQLFPLPDDGYKTDSVTVDGTNIPSSGGQYKFTMPDKDVTIAVSFVESGVEPVRVLYNSGYTVGANAGIETNWGTTGEAAAEGSYSEVPNEGIEGKAIKLQYETVTDYLAFKITLDTPINADTVDGLSLWARTSYKGTGATSDILPGINRVVFGCFDDGAWTDSVWYAGEDNTYNDIAANWKQIVVPVAGTANKQIDTIMLYFTPKQIQRKKPNGETADIAYFIDRISFFKVREGSSRELTKVTIPAAAMNKIPYALSDGSGALATNLDYLTMATTLQYTIDGSTYTLYGKDGDPSANNFMNKFTEFFTPVYTVTDGTAGVNGATITPSAVNTTFKIKAAYDGVESEDMTVSVWDYPQTSATIIDFSTLGYTGLVRLPLYWGGTAGDAQLWNNIGTTAPVLNGFIDNITINPRYFPDGYPMDDWFVFGNSGLNHDLSAFDKIVFSAAINEGCVYNFTLSSGYEGVDSTLTANPDTGKFEKQSYTAAFTGKGKSWQNYEIDLAAAEAAGVDLSCITEFQYFTDAALNTSEESLTGWAMADPFLHISTITAAANE